MASQVNGYIGQINPGNGTNYAVGSTVYGVCDTAAATAAKTVDMTGFTLITGATVHIKFTNANTASNPTLNINSTGAKAIELVDDFSAGTNTGNLRSWRAGSILSLTYDGSTWIANYAMPISSSTSYDITVGTSGSDSNTASTNGNTYVNWVTSTTSYNDSMSQSISSVATNRIHLVPGNNMNIVSDASGNVTFTATDTTYSNATTSVAGLMSAADKTALDSLVASRSPVVTVNSTAPASALTGDLWFKIYS